MSFANPLDWAARPLTREMEARLREQPVVHLSYGCHYDSIVGKFAAATDDGRAIHDITLLPSRGGFLNLTVMDSARLRTLAPSAYLWCFLGEPGPVAGIVNVNNLGRSAAERNSSRLRIIMRGVDVLERCDGRVFFRALDSAVAIADGYRGPAIVEPSRHRTTPA